MGVGVWMLVLWPVDGSKKNDSIFLDDDGRSAYACCNVYYEDTGHSMYKPIGKPCYDCEYCDNRQRYGWFYDKYHNKCVNYEYIAFLQKVSISLIVLYSTSQKGTSLILLIIFNLFFICITAWFRPYLTDEEFEKVQRLGRTKANIKRDKKCSRKSCGVSNSLDILLLTAVTSMLISALIIHDLKEELVQKGIYTTSSPLVVAVAVNATNATKNDEINLSDAIHSEGTLSNQETTEKEKLAKLIANHYPADNIMIIMFEYIGLILFMAGFLYFLKHILIYICKTICRKRQKKKGKNEDEKNAIALTQI